jgi:hypothetical protein
MLFRLPRAAFPSLALCFSATLASVLAQLFQRRSFEPDGLNAVNIARVTGIL